MVTGLGTPLEILDGMLLGDAGLVMCGPNALFAINLSKRGVSTSDHLRWLTFVKGHCLVPLGVPVSGIYPKATVQRSSSNQLYTVVTLRSSLSPVLAEQYCRWYAQTGELRKKGNTRYRAGDVKILPSDLALTPASLAHWFLGDGGCSLGNFGGYLEQRASLSAYGFAESEGRRLTDMLNGMGVNTCKPTKRTAGRGTTGLRIWLSMADGNINRFIDIIEPFILPIFENSRSPSYKDMLARKHGVLKANIESFNQLRDELRTV